jgi:hypothetical protein
MLSFASIRLPVVLWTSCFLCCTTLRAAELRELLAYLPADSNALLIVNAKKIFESEVGRDEAWKQDYEKTYATTPLLMPPDSQLFLMGARIDYEKLAPQWEVAVADIVNGPSIQSIADKSRGTVDEISGFQAVETLRDLYIVQFTSTVFGARKPANRQAVSQWLRDVQSRQAPSLSTYLEEQAVYPEKVGTEIILAFDLHELLRAEDVRRAMQASPAVQKASVPPENVAEILRSVRGVTLGVRVTDRIYGALKIDFEKETTPLADIAQPLLMELTSEAGAMLNEFTAWSAKAQGKRLTWEGELTRPGLRKLFSFMELDATPIHEARQDTSSSSATEEANKPYLSKQYFNKVETYLEDLSNEEGAVSFGQIGLWLDKYARRIERMPTLYVDDDLVDYGMWVTQKLREATAAIQGVGIRTGARTAQVGGYGGYDAYGGYTGWRPYGALYPGAQQELRDVTAQKQAIGAEERAVGAAQARQIMQEIRGETQKMRRSMTERYKIQF